jgi:large subunit ribosomal protein L1
VQHGKNYRKVAELVDRSALYAPIEAIRLARQTPQEY